MREPLSEGKKQVGSFGERLRREREMRGVTLDDIAEATKIGTRLLRALEEEHFELLPGGIFNKGFVRAYAKYLGLNEDQAVADYLEAAGETVPDPRVIAEQNSSRIDRSPADRRPSGQAGFPIIPVLILLLVIAAGAGGWQIYKERVRDREAKRQASSSGVIATSATATPIATNPAGAATPLTPSDTGVANTGSHGATSPPNTGAQANPTTPASANLNAPAAKTLDAGPKVPIPESPGSSIGVSNAGNTQPFEVKVRAKDSAWVSIKSDGKYIVRGIIGPPDVKTVHASDQVVVFTGNAGAVEVSFNGQPVPLPGGPNQEGVLVFNSHGAVSPKPAQ
ncbi:MAG TPA: RodZ domain-containing protein [Terriglobales bacterium]